MKKSKEYILVSRNKVLKIIAVDCQPNPLDDSTFICQYEDRKEKWRVVDRGTGMAISHGRTKKECIQQFIKRSSIYLNYKNTNPMYKKHADLFNELRKEEENGKR